MKRYRYIILISLILFSCARKEEVPEKVWETGESEDTENPVCFTADASGITEYGATLNGYVAEDVKISSGAIYLQKKGPMAGSVLKYRP